MPIIRKFQGIEPKIAESSFIAENAVITGDTEIGEKTGIWYNCVLRGDVASIKIGSNTNIQDGTVVHVTRANHIANKTKDEGGPVVIGDNVTVGHSCILHACTISSNVFVGMQSMLMDLSHMEESSMLAAGSLLTPGKVVKTGELWGGRPAKFMRMLRQEEIDYIKISADNYYKLAMGYK